MLSFSAAAYACRKDQGPHTHVVRSHQPMSINGNVDSKIDAAACLQRVRFETAPAAKWPCCTKAGALSLGQPQAHIGLGWPQME